MVWELGGIEHPEELSALEVMLMLFSLKAGRAALSRNMLKRLGLKPNSGIGCSYYEGPRIFYQGEFSEGTEKCAVGMSPGSPCADYPGWPVYMFYLLGTSKSYVTEVWGRMVGIAKPFDTKPDLEMRLIIAKEFGLNLD